jgi:hypothetical protein
VDQWIDDLLDTYYVKHEKWTSLEELAEYAREQFYGNGVIKASEWEDYPDLLKRMRQEGIGPLSYKIECAIMARGEVKIGRRKIRSNGKG